ncbi:phospholipase D-like domain-containing protein, partial [Desulfobulbus alkaliphilus]|uniref:phospholipase D-like domain-containing protein n=1 Tax=Desulfobulbus alkaliphilus TaxID=869814 RepID=UPI001F058D73
MYQQTLRTGEKGHTDQPLNGAPRWSTFKSPPRRKNKTVRRVLRLLARSREKGGANVHFPDNRVVLLRHGGDFFPALFQAMAEARSTICAEYYIIRNDATGTSFARSLMEAAARGVQVVLIYDFIGCFETPDEYFQQLRNNGVHCLSFNQPTFSRLRLLDSRNHRKMVVIDGITAFLGGLNVGDEYAGYGDSFQHWRDAGIRVDGSAAGRLRRLFRRTWVLSLIHS